MRSVPAHIQGSVTRFLEAAGGFREGVATAKIEIEIEVVSIHGRYPDGVRGAAATDALAMAAADAVTELDAGRPGVRPLLRMLSGFVAGIIIKKVIF